MSYEIKQDGKFSFIEEGSGEILMLLHGLFGALSNFQDLVEHFKKNYTVVVPILPLLTMDLLHTTVGNSAVYPYLQPLAPSIINSISSFIPWFKNMFSQLEQFFAGISSK